MSRMYAKITLQDYFPADLTLLGLRNIYSEVEENAFYVNSSCVVAKDKILTKGKHYMLLNIPTKTDIKITEIVLIDLFFYEGSIHLISEDINTHRVSIVNFCLECPETNCTKYLVDVNYFIDRMNERAIKQYCGNYNETKTIHIGADKLKINDDLLEFEL